MAKKIDQSAIRSPQSAIDKPIRVLVMGAGAMGSSVGGFLAKGGHEVTLVSLDEAHVASVRQNGLRITGIWGDHLVKNLRIQKDLDGLAQGDFDAIFVSVKSYDTSAAAQTILPLVDDDTLVCAYQNGLGNAERIAEQVGWARTIGARVIYGVRPLEPGCVEITVIAAPTALGVYDANAPSDRVREIVAAMDASGVPTIYSEEIATLLWGKVAYNCALNPLSALLDTRYGGLVETEHTLAIIREVVSELYAVARAMQVRLKPRDPEAYMALLMDKLIPPTAAHYASMREDFRQGRRTEIDALNGAICRYGEKHGVPCPTNTMLTRLVHAREHALRRGRG